MGTAILELIAMGSKIFEMERREYFTKRSKKLMERIQEVEDSDFYKKDMEAKGRAERAILLDQEELRQEYMKAAATI